MRKIATFFLILCFLNEGFALVDPQALIEHSDTCVSVCEKPPQKVSKKHAIFSGTLAAASYDSILDKCKHVTVTQTPNGNYHYVVDCEWSCTPIIGNKHDGTGNGEYRRTYVFKYGFKYNAQGVLKAYAEDEIEPEIGHDCTNHEGGTE